MKALFEKITAFLNNIPQSKRKYFVIGFFVFCLVLFTLDCYVGTLSYNNVSNETKISHKIEEIKQQIDSIDIILSKIDSITVE